MEQQPQSRRKSIEVSQDGIVRKENSIAYLGVELPKAEVRGDFTPGQEHIAKYIDDPFIAQPMQRDLAVAFHAGQPLLMEGGTSLGKTSTVRKMCAELGYELYYINLNGGSDPENLMGRYIPNAGRKEPGDPEYTFADGPVTAGLKQEEGKIRVILIDELNSATSDTLIRLHEVLDALEVGGSVVLTEDGSESIATDKAKTKIVGLTNPPGKGYLDRKPLDPAQLRRWVYKKYPDQLPAGTFEYVTDAIFFGKADPVESGEKAPQHYKSRNTQLTIAELQVAPEYRSLVKAYEALHGAAVGLLKKRSIAADQPQLFTFDDRMEPRRILNFVRTFAKNTSGESLIEAFKSAFTYYYLDKLASPEDKERLTQLVETSLNVPITVDPRRRTPEGKEEGKVWIMLQTVSFLYKKYGVSENDMRATFPERVGEREIAIDLRVPSDAFEEAKRNLSIAKSGPVQIPSGKLVRNMSNIFAEIKGRGWLDFPCSLAMDPNSKRIFLVFERQ